MEEDDLFIVCNQLNSSGQIGVLNCHGVKNNMICFFELKANHNPIDPLCHKSGEHCSN